MFKLDLEKAEEPEINLSYPLDHRKSKGFPEKHLLLCAKDRRVDHNKLWKILKEMGIPDHFTCFLRNLYAGKKLQLEPDMEQGTSSKLGKE